MLFHGPFWAFLHSYSYALLLLVAHGCHFASTSASQHLMLLLQDVLLHQHRAVGISMSAPAPAVLVSGWAGTGDMHWCAQEHLLYLMPMPMLILQSCVLCLFGLLHMHAALWLRLEQRDAGMPLYLNALPVA